MRFGTLIILIIFLGNSFGLSQNIKFKTYTVENGLSNNSVNTIEIDKYGALWIGTWDGIDYYDGHEFITYKHIPNDSTSIPNNFINKIEKDNHNQLWISSTGTQISLANKDGTFINYDFNKRVDDIGLSKNKSILVKVANQFYTFANDKFIECSNCNFYDTDLQWKQVFANFYPYIEWVSNFKDSRGNLWIGTRNEGLFYVPTNKILDLKKTDIQNYKNDPYSKFSLQSNEIIEITEDDFGNIWIGTKDGGLSRVYKNSEAVFYVSNHPVENPLLPTEAIRAIAVDTHQQLWLGYYSQGLFVRRKDSSIFTHLEIPKVKENKEWNKIRSLYTASDGSVFGGTYAGVFRYRNGVFSYYQASDYPLLPNNRNYSFYETYDNQIYVACWGGVALFDLKKNDFVPFDGQSDLNNLHVRDLIKIENVLYIATEESGVIKLENGIQTKIIESSNAPENSVYTLWYDDANGNLWCGTLNGIIIYSINQKEIVKRFSEKNGLKGHLIYGILGHDNQVWVSTTDGLLIIDKNTFDIYIYPGQEGLQAAEFSEGAYYKDRKHIMYFGGVKGLNYFNPDNIDLKEDVPILKIYTDKKDIDGDYSKPYKSNEVEFTIDPTFYGISNGNQIYYKLEGLDTKWQVTNYDKKVIRYTNIPAGKYIFKVKNNRSHQEGNHQNLLINIPFWKSFYFYAIVFIITLLGIILYFFYKRKIQLKREKVLEQKIEERVKQISIQKEDIALKNDELVDKNQEISSQKETLQELHAKLKTESMELDRFNTYLIQEYKNPLSQISHQLQGIDSDKIPVIQHEVNGLLNKILAINYLNKIDKNYKLQKSVVELEKTTEDILNEIALDLDEAHIKFRIVKNTQKLWVLIDVMCFKLMLKYLFTDIIKYPDSDSVLEITYDITPANVHISIKTANKILNKNLYYIQHYSPYNIACKTIAQLLSIDFKLNNEITQSSFQINFEPHRVTEEKNDHTKLNWMHIEMEPHIDKNKATILVWANEVDTIIIHQILPIDTYNIIVEKDKNLLLSVIKSININMFLIFNQPLNQDVYKITTKLNSKYPEIKIVFISDKIDYELEHQSIEMGMDDIIHLPANKAFVSNKLQKLLDSQKLNYSKQNIYDSLNQIFQDKTNSQNEKLIKKALLIIQKRMSESDFNVKELCEDLDISTIKCYRVFKEVLNIPPSEFILNIKMNKAEALLKNSSLNIAEIAYETGFADPKYFSKVFKKCLGISPKKYKQEKV